MADETYNGWTNRETWAVALWINNDQGAQESVFELVRELVDRHQREQDDRAEAGRYDEPISPTFVGEQVREWLDDTLDMLLDGDSAARETYKNWRDDLGSLWRVDWHEIGRSFLESATERDDT